MKRISIFAFVLALGAIIAQPLHALPIDYTFQGTFSVVPGGAGDPWGIGSGTGTAVLDFTLAPPPSSTSQTSWAAFGIYDVLGTLNLSGTNVNGTYPVAITPSLNNVFSSNPPNVVDSMDATTNITFVTLPGHAYTLWYMGYLPQDFWGDSEVPPLPKVVNQNDILVSGGVPFTDLFIYETSLTNTFYHGYGDAVTITSQVVPEPSTMLLLCSGLIGLLGFRKKFKK